MKTTKIVEKCQVCNSNKLEPIIFLGYLPPVNQFHKIGEKPKEQPSYPSQLLYCAKCHVVQLGLIVDQKILFPPEYPYTSSTTKVLRVNFAELYQECKTIINIGKNDLIVDIGSNDGNLLSNFRSNHRVLGITPEEIGKTAIANGIPTIINYFNSNVVKKIKKDHGKAKIITATNVFAHIDNINEITKLILELLTDDGMFISESHYLLKLIETLQYDTIYHEHLRYYSLHSLKFLLEKHGFEIIHAKEIPTHGGSIRVYAAKKGKYKAKDTVKELLEKEKNFVTNKDMLLEFKNKVAISKLQLHSLILDIKKRGKSICGIGAPSRASTLINYTGIDDSILDYILEIKGSYKIGKYMPGTIIPVVEESKMFENQPDYALILSWHISNELVPKLRQKGFKGKFIVPLPSPHILDA